MVIYYKTVVGKYTVVTHERFRLNWPPSLPQKPQETQGQGDVPSSRDYTWLAKHFVRDFGIDPSARYGTALVYTQGSCCSGHRATHTNVAEIDTHWGQSIMAKFLHFAQTTKALW